MTQAYGSPPPRAQRSPWFWVGIGCAVMTVTVIVFAAFVVTVIVASMRRSTPYQDAMKRARNDGRVVAALGEPIEPGLFVGGSVRTNNRDGEAQLDIPIRGPKGKATLRVVGTKTRGRWSYEQMIVTPENGDEIDLLPSSEGSPRTDAPIS